MNGKAAAIPKNIIPHAEMGLLPSEHHGRRVITASDAKTMLLGLLRVGDAGVVLVSGVVSYGLRYETLEIEQQYWFAIVLGSLLACNFLHAAHVYRFSRIKQWWSPMGRVAACWGWVLLTIVAIAYCFKISDTLSRIWVMQWGLLALVGFGLLRGLAAVQVDRWQRNGVALLSVAIVGIDGSGRRLAELLRRSGKNDLRIVGIFEIDGGSDQQASRTLQDLFAMSRRLPLDEVIVAYPNRSVSDVMLRRLGTLPANVRLWADLPGCDQRVPVDGDVFSDTGATMLFERPLAGWNALAKRAEDIVLSTLALVVMAPLMLVIAVAIKLDSSGPAVFWQRRYGFNNDEFWVCKFRTMVEAAAVDADATQARRDDPRVTPVGRILRRTSLDELPQLFNVLKGEMSLVGPRPHPVPMNEHYTALIDRYPARHRVRPGITGWAQVNGFRGETDTLEKMLLRLEHDLYYIDRWSLFLDLQIMFRTLFVGFVNRNAY